jgi:hypothetical protein
VLAPESIHQNIKVVLDSSEQKVTQKFGAAIGVEKTLNIQSDFGLATSRSRI